MTSTHTTTARKWWQTAVVYQIYPSSFKDSNGDGLGDIPGILSKVDYLKSLGINAVWLSPVCKSPQVDMGYDISDYREIHAPYGTVKDIEALIAALGQHDIKLIMDVVVNHTSEEHPWFLASKSSLDHPKRDWYIWRKGKKGRNGEQLPPNNWESLFKGSAWTYDETTDEWYLHIFAVAQPCLNWKNPAVRAAVEADMHFWLEKGLGGFRLDAINLISKPDDFSDAPVTKGGPYQPFFELTKNRPPVHEWLKEIRKSVFDKYDNLVQVGERGGTWDVDETSKYVHPDRKELDMIFQFEITEVDKGPGGAFTPRSWHLSELKQITQKWQTVLKPGWNAFHMENHDAGRSVNRYSRDPDSRALPAVSKMLACFHMTLGGTIFLHQGQEIGSQNLAEDVELHHYMDFGTQREYDDIKAIRSQTLDHDDVDMSDVMKEIRLKARDHGRVPMAWDNTDGAGFTTGAKPWMTVHPEFKKINVAAQDKEKNSVLNTWREMIKFRKQYPDELVYGKFELVDEKHEDIFAYRRTAENGEEILVALNWSPRTVRWSAPAFDKNNILITVGLAEPEETSVVFSPYACTCWRPSGK